MRHDTVFVIFDDNNKEICVFDNVDDMIEFCNNRPYWSTEVPLFKKAEDAIRHFSVEDRRKAALAKLTKEDREALGLS